MSDISLAVGNAVRRMTYAEIAAVRGISVASARRLVLRQGWPRHVSNDSGIVRVLVPAAEARKSRLNGLRRQTPDNPPTEGAVTPLTARVVTPPIEAVVTPPISDSDITVISRMFEAALEALREQLAHERTRADAERALADGPSSAETASADRADRAEQELAAVHIKLIEARVEAAGLRCKLVEAARPKPAPAPRRSWWRRWRRA